MPRTLDQVIDGLAADERAEVEARTRELIAEETSLRALRRENASAAVARYAASAQPATGMPRTFAYELASTTSHDRWAETSQKLV